MHRHTILLALITAACTRGRPYSGATPAESADVAAIRAERAASNAAIARRDAVGTASSMVAAYRVLPAGAPATVSRDSMVATLERQFADPAMLGYVRTPITIDISVTAPTAAEQGRWVGRRRRADGIQETSGTYYAAWRKTPEGWRLQTETFVALSCVGSAECPVVPRK